MNHLRLVATAVVSGIFILLLSAWGSVQLSSPTLTPIATFTPAPLAAGTKRTDSTGINQVWVPAGCFMMGSTDQQVQDAYAQAKIDYGSRASLDWFEIEKPQHKVCMTQGYWLDQYDVTNVSFDAFVKAGGYSIDAYWSADGLKWKQSNHFTGPDTSCTQYSSEPQQPRDCVSWFEGEAYANWRTITAKDGSLYRLPTGAEWEYAARGPESLIYPWGNTFDGMRLNYCDRNCSDWADKSVDDGYAYTSPVGTYENGKSWVNAYDMAGNVWQWTADWYDANYYQNTPSSNPTGPTRGTTRLLGGGSWFDDQSHARSASRNYGYPRARGNFVGFRLVRVVPS